jgi:hypothetical protein
LATELKTQPSDRPAHRLWLRFYDQGVKVMRVFVHHVFLHDDQLIAGHPPPRRHAVDMSNSKKSLRPAWALTLMVGAGCPLRRKHAGGEVVDFGL